MCVCGGHGRSVQWYCADLSARGCESTEGGKCVVDNQNVLNNFAAVFSFIFYHKSIDPI